MSQGARRLAGPGALGEAGTDSPLEPEGGTGLLTSWF